MADVDIVLATIPVQQNLTYVQSAPAQLKAVVEQAGFRCKTLDFNLDFWWQVSYAWAYDYATMWSSMSFENVSREDFDNHWHSSFHHMAVQWINTVQSYHPRWLGFSVFHKFNISVFFLRELCKLSRLRLPGTKLVVGGNAISVTGLAKEWLAEGLIDAYVAGEGEHAIVELLNGNYGAPGINGNTRSQLEDINTIPYADYSDYAIEHYGGGFFVELTRGCARHCKFCQKVLSGIRSKNGERVADEIIRLQHDYGSRLFKFADCAFNNNTEALRECLTKLIYYYNNDLMKRSWFFGDFSCFPRSHTNEEMYFLMSKAGVGNIGVGIESGSEAVRQHMGKPFSDDDIDFLLEQCAKNGIYVGVGIIVGYPTETEDDFQKTLDLFTRYERRSWMMQASVGAPCYLFENTWIHDHQDKMGIYWDDYGNWVCPETGNTMQVRANRWLRLRDHVRSLGYYVDESFISREAKEMFEQMAYA